MAGPRGEDAISLGGISSTVSGTFLEHTTMNVYYDKDADLSLIKGKNVTIIGYGS